MLMLVRAGMTIRNSRNPTMGGRDSTALTSAFSDNTGLSTIRALKTGSVTRLNNQSAAQASTNLTRLDFEKIVFFIAVRPRFCGDRTDRRRARRMRRRGFFRLEQREKLK